MGGMLARRTLLGAALLSGCAGPSVPSSAPPVHASTVTPPAIRAAFDVTVMSWNVMTQGLGPDHYDPSMPRADHDWATRAPQVQEWLRFTDPDVAGFQEALGVTDAQGRPSNLMVDMLPDREWANIDHFLPIMFRASLFQLEDAGVVEIYPGSAASPWQRYCSWARLRHRATGGPLFVFNTHLPPFQTAAVAAIRADVIATLIAQLHRLDPSYQVPAVLVGDLNARSNETRPVFREHLTRLAADGWRNSDALTRHDTTTVPGASTLNGFGAKLGGQWHYRLISTTGPDYDYVWVRRGTSVARWQTVLGPGVRWLTIDGQRRPFFADGPVPSDHCPVLATLTL